jgi:oxygen-independent coproporphyrinogen III oxidase
MMEKNKITFYEKMSTKQLLETKVQKMLKEQIYPGYFPEYPLRKEFKILKENFTEKLKFNEKIRKDLYIHIPFCKSKCSFCKLYSVINTNKNELSEYVDSLCGEIMMYHNFINKSSYGALYFGGGTPLLLDLKHLSNIFNAISKLTDNFGKISIETTPGCIDKDKILFLKDKGLKRLSIGIQSFNEKELEFMGRSINLKEFENKYTFLRKFDIEINLDFIYGLPYQKKENLIMTLKKVSDLKPDSVFFYPLRIKPSTSLHLQNIKTDNKLIFELYDLIKKYMEDNQFKQISYLEYHNNPQELYFGDSYKQILGFGAGACSHLEDIHFINADIGNNLNIRDYIIQYNCSIKRKKMPEKMGVFLDSKTKVRKYFILGLRNKGVDKEEFENFFKKNIKEEFGLEIGVLKKYKLIKEDNYRIYLSEEGIKNTENIIRLFH